MHTYNAQKYFDWMKEYNLNKLPLTASELKQKQKVRKLLHKLGRDQKGTGTENISEKIDEILYDKPVD